MGCLNCGKELINLPKKREKIFCDNTCRSNYWQKAKRLSDAGKSDDEIVKILSVKPNKPVPATKKENTANVEQKKEKDTVAPEKHELWKLGDPKEGSGAFYIKYDCNNYDELIKLKTKK